jgi:ABC-type transport system, involved in lipoprotein release, permease component
MSLISLVWNYLKARPLNTAINIVLLSLGIAVITILLLFNKQLEQKISTNSRGIDLVVGAKGSPLQLILCNIFHIDFPTGNISLAEAERISKHRLIKKAIPLALGDSYKSYRIIGTNRDYAALYKAELAEGQWFQRDLEVTIGATVAEMSKLKLGDTFESAHGLAEGGHSHNDHLYKVTGILKPSYTVVDNLILTNVESVWLMHHEEGESAEEEDHDHDHDGHDHDHEHHHHAIDSAMRSPLVPSVAKGDSTLEITSMLVQYRSPMGAIQLPRLINSDSNLQAASPAFETARLFSILGVGIDILMAFAYVLILISALSIFIALYNSLKERRYDLAILRSMGAGRGKLFISILLEGGLLTFLGSLTGLIMAHIAVLIISSILPEIQKSGISGLVFYSEEWIILAASLLLGLACALIPAIQAYRTDISRVLAGNA